MLSGERGGFPGYETSQGLALTAKATEKELLKACKMVAELRASGRRNGH
jgi:hypothetical protein